jgi:hypothetical protein
MDSERESARKSEVAPVYLGRRKQMKTLWPKSAQAIFPLFLLLLLPSPAICQYPDAWRFPEALRPSLDARLRSFTQAQASGDWDKVSLLLGQYRRGGSYMPYAPSHKACLVSQMQQMPMIDFVYEVYDKSFSSEILSTPPERRWWTLVGTGTFVKDSKTVTAKTFLVAYRDQGEWFFTPPPYDNSKGSFSITPEMLETDLKDEVELRVAADSPIEIADLHVFIDKDNYLLRHISFRFRNRTQKRVTRYDFEISDSGKDGSISEGTGAQRDWIDPQGTSREYTEEYVTAFYRCEGERKIYIEIQSAGFEDGTEWNSEAFKKLLEEDKSDHP